MIGTFLGPYKIIEQIGAGGMGEVYLGEDTRLNRSVAIKVLPAQFADDPERLARFEQEARAAAALNHPHIAAVFDVGSEQLGDGAPTRFIVQEYLEGHSLRSGLAKGVLPLTRALRLAVEVGEALSAAHKTGIIHRDLKPDNVFVTEEGHAKVLDFGLAKLAEIAGPAPGTTSMSPTMLGTVAGQVMGTAGYMAPEQVNGEEIDPRADLFGFGCVLYEMSSGKRAFTGETVLDTLHAIVRTEPQPLGEIKPDLPAELQRILRKCLAKDPAARYQAAADLVVDLRALAGDVETGSAVSIAHAAPARMPGGPSRSGAASRTKLALVATLPALVVGAAVGAWAWLAPSSPADYPIRFEITRPAFWDHEGNGVLVSPDGRSVLFGGLPEDGSEPVLHIREAGSTVARELPEIAPWPAYPFYSPDGEWLAFRQDGNLVKAPLSGGSPSLVHALPAPPGEMGLASAPEFRSFQGGFWSSDGSILFSSGGALYRIPDDGGEPPTLLVEADPELGELRHPDLLPDGRAALVTLWRNSPDDARVGIADLVSGEVLDLRIDGSDPQYVPTGHLVWVRDDAIFAAPFDPERREVTGARGRVQEGIEVGPAGPGKLSISPAGTLAYSAAGASGDFSLVWIDRNGNREAIRSGITQEIWTPRLSPDGRRIVMALGGQSYISTQLWIYDIDGETLTALTTSSEVSVANFPVWSPDGASLLYTSILGEGFAVFERPANFTGEARSVVSGTPDAMPFSFTPGGDELAIVIGEISTGGDISIVSVDTGESRVLLDDPANEAAPMISPDGRWLAYVSNVSGGNQVYVRPLAGPGVRTQVSNDGGVEPRWSPDGSELFYRTGPYGEAMMAVDVTASEQFEFGERRQLFINPRATTNPALVFYDVSPDGQRFLMAERGSGQAARGGIVVIFNWFEELKARVPRGR